MRLTEHKLRTMHHIYIYVYIYIYNKNETKGYPTPCFMQLHKCSYNHQGIIFLLNTISNINNVNVKKKIQTKNIRPTSPVYPEKVHTLTLLILQGVEHSV